MSFFGSILEKLGLGNAAAASAPSSTSAPASAPAAPPSGAPPPISPAPTSATSVVDVTAQLEKRAAANPQKLNWRTSIVDLMKLLEIDSSLTARKSLATELACPTDLMADSAKMNVWLHKTVIARIAANGGKVPQDLLS